MDSLLAEIGGEKKGPASFLETLLKAQRLKPRSNPPIPDPPLQEGDISSLSRQLLHAPGVSTVEALDIITLLLTGEWRTPDLQALRALAGDAARTGVCGTVWKLDELAYKCKTCERDPTCAICVPCFRHGDHEGHDYAMIKTGGGCCDCGDVQAWKPNGFCTRHRGASGEDDDPAAPMSPHLRGALVEAVSPVAEYVLTNCRRFHTTLLEEAAMDEAPKESACQMSEIKSVVACLNWMGNIVHCGDGIRRVVGVYLSKPLDTSWLGSMLRLDGVERLPAKVVAALHALYYQLITDLVFKRAFLESFIGNYPRFVHALVVRRRKRGAVEVYDTRKIDIMDNFCVQLFTVPALIPVMMRRGGLLDVLMEMILHLLESAALPVLPYLDIDPGESQYEVVELKKNEGNLTEEVARFLAGGPRFPHGVLPLPTWVFKTSEESLPLLPLEADLGLVYGTDPPGIFRRNQSTSSSRAPDTNVPRRTRNRGFSFHMGSRVGGSSSTGEADTPGQSTRARGARAQRTRQGSGLGRIFTCLPRTMRMDSQTPRGPGGNSAGNTRSTNGSGTGVGAEPSTVLQGVSNFPRWASLTDGHYVSLRDAIVTETASGHQFYNTFSENTTLNRTYLESIREIQAGAVQADSRDFERLSERVQTLLKQREMLQQMMFEDGVRDIEPAKRGPCPLYSKDFGLWYRAAIADARQRSKAAANDTGTIAHTMRLEYFQSPIMDAVVWRVINDLRYVLTHSEIAVHLMHHRPDLFRTFVRILSMLQGIFPNRRHFGEHVDVETETWAKGFTIEIEIFNLIQFLGVAFCRNPDPLKPADIVADSSIHGGKAEKLTAVQSRARCLAIVRQCLSEWVEREKGLEQMSVVCGEEFSVAHSVSVHLPLHRLLSLLGHHAVRLDGVSPAFALSGSNVGTTPEEAMDLLLHPLRVQAFLAQVRAGMWRRNGKVVVGQAMLYRAVVCAEWFVDMDLFFQQTCAIVAGEERFVGKTLSTFQIKSFSEFIRLPDRLKALNTSATPSLIPSLVTGTPVAKADIESIFHSANDIRGFSNKATDKAIRELSNVVWVPTSLGENAFFGTYRANLTLAEYAPSLVEDLIMFLVHVTTERSRCGFDDRSYLRRKLVHLLACSDYTHSTLIRASPRRLQQPTVEEESDTSPVGSDKVDTAVSTMVDALLNEVADFEQPHGMQQGRYRLKDKIWPEFDRFSAQVSVRERPTADERYLAACKRMNCNPLPFQDLSVSTLPLYEGYQGLKKIATWLCSQGSESLAKLILEKCIQKGGVQSLEGALVGALYFACMAVEFAAPGSSGTQNGTPSNFFNEWLSNQVQSSSEIGGTSLDYIAEMYYLSRDSLGPFQDLRHGLVRVLREAHARGDSGLQQRLASKLPSLFSVGTSTGAASSEADSDNSAISQRLRRMREMKKKMQAAAMAQMRASQEKFEKHIEDGDPKRSQRSDLDLFVENGAGVATSSRHRSDWGKSFDAISGGSNDPAFSEEQKCDGHAQTCALCREEASEDGGYMGLVGFLQTTTIPVISRRRRIEPQCHGAESKTLTAMDASTGASHMDTDFMEDVAAQVTQTVEEEEVADEAETVPREWQNYFHAPNLNNMMAILGESGSEDEDDIAADVENMEDQGDNAVPRTPVPRVFHGPAGTDLAADLFAPRANRSPMELDNVGNADPTVSEGLQRRFLDWNRVRLGCDQTEGVHFGFCGHSIHSKCFNRYFLRLEQSQSANERYEGEHVVDLTKGEFLCPFCRRLANFLLPVSKVGVKPAGHAFQEASAVEAKDKYDAWMKKIGALGKQADRTEGRGHDGMDSIAPDNNAANFSEKGRNGVPLVYEIQGLAERRTSKTASDALKNVAHLGIHQLKVLKRLGDWHEWRKEHNTSLQRNVMSEDISVSCVNVLMHSVITTVLCAEIECRSGAWAGSESQAERRLLGMLIREARVQAGTFPNLQTHHLKQIWEVVKQPKGENKEMWKMDAFSCFVFLLLLWDGDLMVEDVHGSLRLCYQLAIKQAVYRLKRQGDNATVVANVEREVLLFLRRAAIYCSCFLEIDIAIVQYAQDKKELKGEVIMEMNELLYRMQLPSIEEAVPDLQEMLCEVPHMFSESMKPYTVELFSPKRFGLVSLPRLFQDLLESLEARSCHLCNSTPQKPVLCLACGDVFCYGRIARSTCGGKEQHARECGKGIGVFLVLMMTSVLVIRHRRKARWGSPYLDEHGEEDHELHRGKPLYLSMERYQALEKLWLSHRFDHDFRILNHQFMEPALWE